MIRRLTKNCKVKNENCKLKICILHIAIFILQFLPGGPLCRAADLNAEIEKITGAARFKTAHWGILIVETKTGETVYEHQSDKLFAPASVTKLFSTAAALDALSADYRFRTPIYARGKIDDQGRLDGDLILVASGDPTLGGRTDSQGKIAFTDNDHIYAQFSGTAELTPQDPLTGLNELARQVAAKGVQRIGGDVRVDDRLFDHTESTGSGPNRVTPIMVNDNLLDVIVEPTIAGKPAKVRWRPETAAVQVDAAVQTVEKGEPRISIKPAGAHKLVVRGSVAVGGKPVVRTHEVDDPAGFARSLLVEALRRVGIEVAASPLAGNSGPLPDAAAYAGMKKVAELESLPFSESARLVLKVSHNLHASALPLWIAVKHGKRTLADGMRLEGEFFGRCGIEKPAVSFGGAAGGARSDYVTPRATVQLLRHMATRKDFGVYKDALPVLGVDGTLSKAVEASSPARGKVFAKTGTLVWDNLLDETELLTSKSLAGYLTTKSGRELSFAVFVNMVPLAKNDGGARGVGKVLGQLCEVIHANGDK